MSCLSQGEVVAVADRFAIRDPGVNVEILPMTLQMLRLRFSPKRPFPPETTLGVEAGSVAPRGPGSLLQASQVTAARPLIRALVTERLQEKLWSEQKQ